jgi:hypothetical protein
LTSTRYPLISCHLIYKSVSFRTFNRTSLIQTFKNWDYRAGYYRDKSICTTISKITGYTDSSLASGPKYQNENKNNTMEGSKKRIENWKSLIDDLKRCGEIKSVIKAQQAKKRYDKKRNDDSDTKKQEISYQIMLV